MWSLSPAVDPVGLVGVKLQHISTAPVCAGRCSVLERATRVEQSLEIRGCGASWIRDRTHMLPCFYCSFVASLMNSNASQASQAFIFELS